MEINLFGGNWLAHRSGPFLMTYTAEYVSDQIFAYFSKKSPLLQELSLVQDRKSDLLVCNP